MLDVLDGPVSGELGFFSFGDVPGASGADTPGTLLVGNFPLTPGGFLTARLDVGFIDAGFSSLTTTEALGHETPVPEPSTWLLLGSGLAGLILWRKRAIPR